MLSRANLFRYSKLCQGRNNAIFSAARGFSMSIDPNSEIDSQVKSEAIQERIVILGTGWGGFNLANTLRKTDDREISVVSPSNHFVFTPLLPSTAVGTVEFRAIQEPVRTVPSITNYYHAKAKNIDFDKQEILCDTEDQNERFTLKYDKLVISVGVKTNTFNTPNIAEREGIEVFFLKHLYHARSIRNRTIQMFENAAIPGLSEDEKKRLLQFVIVGGGPTSCEYAAELHDFLMNDMSRLYPDLLPYVKVTLVEAGPELLGPFDANLREYVMGLFEQRKIEVLTRTAVTGVDIYEKEDYKLEASKCFLSDGTEREFGTMIWSAGLSPVKFTDRLPSKIQRTKQGRIIVDKFLRVKGQEGKVWAVGDCAEVEDRPLPQLAQVANQQALYLAKVFDGSLNETQKVFRFFSLGSMASLGKSVGIYDGSSAGDPYGVTLGLFKMPQIRGFIAFLMWRTAYWGKQISHANRVLIPVYWFKSWLFGRDTSRF